MNQNGTWWNHHKFRQQNTAFNNANESWTWRLRFTKRLCHLSQGRKVDSWLGSLFCFTRKLTAESCRTQMKIKDSTAIMNPYESIMNPHEFHWISLSSQGFQGFQDQDNRNISCKRPWVAPRVHLRNGKNEVSKSPTHEHCEDRNKDMVYIKI